LGKVVPEAAAQRVAKGCGKALKHTPVRRRIHMSQKAWDLPSMLIRIQFPPENMFA
jgi:hypothetical protein